MCAQVIEARVKQKKDTLANWEANPMILLDGEQAFVVNGDGQPVNFKIGDGSKTFAQLPYWIDYAGGQYISIDGNALPTPTVDVGYTFVGPGTYTFAGQPDIVAPEGRLSQLLWDGSSWSLVDMGELPVVPADAEIELGDLRAASGDATFKALEPVRETIINKNKLDKRLIVAGRRRETDGDLSASDNWISVIIPVKPSTQYTLSGHRGFAITSARILFYSDGVFDEESTIMALGAGNDTPVTFTTGSSHNIIAVNIANVVDIGLNPTDNEYANKVQLEEGAAATEYAPFGYVINGEKITGLDNKFADIATQVTLDSLTIVKTIGGNQLTNKANNRKGQVRTNGTYVGTSDHWCCSDIEPCNPSTTYTSSGHGSANNASMAAVAFYDSSNNFIAGSAVPLSGQDAYTYTSPENAVGRAHTLGNRIDIGLNPSDNELANQFMVNEGSVALPYEQYTGDLPENETFIDGNKITNLPIISLSEITLKKVTDSLFYIFFHVGGSPDKWFRINLVRTTDLGKFSDVWRLNEGWIVQKVDSGFVNVSQTVQNGVYENAIYTTNGYPDAIGGTHGWEMFDSFNVFMDGKKVDLSDPEFTEVTGEYLMFSSLSFFKTVDGTDNVGTSLKRWEFKNGVLSIVNTIRFISSLTINPNGRSFIGMLSVYRRNNDNDLITHSGFTNDDGQVYDISEEGFNTSIYSNQNDPRRNTIVAWGDSFKAELEIKKRLVILADGTVITSGLPNAGMYVQNTDRYNKFYSLFGSTTTQPGDMWETEAEYRFSLT